MSHPTTSVRRSYAPPSSTSLLALLAVMGGALALALLFGLVATTANPILVAVGAAAVVGVFLFAKPTWTIWLMVSAGLLVTGLLPIWAEGLGRRAAWGVSILGFCLLLGALFRAATSRGSTRGTPAFVWVALGFLVYALFVSVLRVNSLFEVLGGTKRYFQAFGLIFALAWLGIGAVHVERLRKLMFWVAMVQLPFALYQLLWLVPFRRAVARAYPGMVPIDVVAGTFGSQLYSGGANAEMATFLIIVIAFLVARFRESLLSWRFLLLATPLVAAPLFLGETKIVIVLLPLVFFVLFKREILARPHVALAGLALGLLLTIAAGYAYTLAMGKSAPELLERTLLYNVGEQGYGSAYLNRTTVLTHWFHAQGLQDPLSAVIGNGLGSSHDATGGHIAARYPGYQISLTAASVLLWDLGLIGLLLFFAILGSAWVAATRLRKSSVSAATRADAAAIQCALVAFAVYIIYRLALLETLSFQIVFGLVLGYLAWLCRQEHAAAGVRAP